MNHKVELFFNSSSHWLKQECQVKKRKTTILRGQIISEVINITDHKSFYKLVQWLFTKYVFCKCIMPCTAGNTKNE